MYFQAVSSVHFRKSDPAQHLVGSVALGDYSAWSAYLLQELTLMTLPNLLVGQKVPEALLALQRRSWPTHLVPAAELPLSPELADSLGEPAQQEAV